MKRDVNDSSPCRGRSHQLGAAEGAGWLFAAMLSAEVSNNTLAPLAGELEPPLAAPAAFVGVVVGDVDVEAEPRRRCCCGGEGARRCCCWDVRPSLLSLNTNA